MNKIIKYDLRIVSAVVFLFILFLLAYWGPLKSLVSEWSASDDYSYGFLIPVITLYLIWDRKRELASTPVSINWTGSLFFILFLAIGLYGILGSSPSAVRPSIPFILISVTLFCFGWQYLKKLFFPLFFLIFMIPLPTIVESTITVPLKLVSTKLGGMILHLFGISVFIQGNVIDLGVTQLQVVDACNGLRYILPLLAMGVIFAYLLEKVLWKRAILVLVTVPISVFFNGLRIGATGILTQKYGPAAAEGFFHDFSGWLVFMFAFVMLILIESLLRRIGKKRQAKETIINKPQLTDSIRNDNRWSTVPVLLVCIFFILLAGVSWSIKGLPRLSLESGFNQFPLTIGEWSGKKTLVDSEMISKSGAEDALSAEYKRAQDEIVSLYIGYRGSPFLENANFFHSPDVCLPSSGWKTLEIQKHTIDMVPEMGSLTVTSMVIEQAGLKQLVYYWFQTKNKTSHNVNINRFHLSLHALKRDNTYDLFIRPITPIPPGQTIYQAKERMDSFVRDMIDALNIFLKFNLVIE